MRWTDRLLGLASTLVLARLLTPSDFGVVAMAMIVVGLVDVLLDLGVAAALIQNRQADHHDFNTAWTLRLCQAALGALIVGLGAPLVGDYMHDPRVTWVMRLIAVSILIGGFENIGVVQFQKQMHFAKDFQFLLTKRLIGVSITIALAIWLRSYWALVIGSLCGRLAGVGLSYRLQQFRPRISLARVKRIWGFSQWNLLMGVASYLWSRLDKFVVGGRAGATTMGAYALADQISSLPTTELLAPLGRVMFPAFVQTAADRKEFQRIVALAFSVQAMLGIPAGVGVALTAQESVIVLLGDQWTSAIPFIAVLGLVGVATSLIHSSHYMLLALGHVRVLAMYFLVQFLAFALLLFLAFPKAAPVTVASLRLATAIAGLLVMQILVKFATPDFRLRTLWWNAWRPLAAALVMTGCITVLSLEMVGNPPLLILAAKVAVGAASYALAILAMWRLAGSPSGAEAYILNSASSWLRRRLT